jgi:hypothetical protein
MYLPEAVLPGRLLTSHRSPLLALVDFTVWTTMPTGLVFKRGPSRSISNKWCSPLGSSSNQPAFRPANLGRERGGECALPACAT